MPFTDEQLVAYADGEVDAAEAQRIATAARDDAQLAARIARFADSRRILADAFSRRLGEPVPERLLAVLQPSKVVPLRREPRRATSTWLPMALAASVALAVGLSAGGLLSRPAGPPVPGMVSDARIVERALLALPSGDSLEGRSGGERYEVTPLASLRTREGMLCREFESSVAGEERTDRARGLACRTGQGGWQIQAIARVSDEAAPAGGDEYLPASGPGVDVMALLPGALRLTPQEEQALIERNWQDGR